MSPLQSKFISDTMKEVKERAAKRQKVCRRVVVDHDPPRVVVDGHQMVNHGVHDDPPRAPRASLISDYDDDGRSCSDDDGSRRFDILDELDAHPHAIRIVATSGGLITHWNDGFTKITKPSTCLKKIPLTIFELVDSKSLASLYGMLALALHNIGIVEVENFSLDEQEETNDDSSEVAEASSLEVAEAAVADNEKLRSPSHLSITLPCKLFRNSSTRYNITIVFMNYSASSKRCFLGILTPRVDECNISDDGSLTGSSYDSAPSIQASSNSTNKTNANGVEHQDEVVVAAPRQELPCGRILRVNDDLLCQMLLGPNSNCE